MTEKELFSVLPASSWRVAVLHLLLHSGTAYRTQCGHLNKGLQGGTQPLPPPPLWWFTNSSWLIPSISREQGYLPRMGIQLQQWPCLSVCVLLILYIKGVFLSIKYQRKSKRNNPPSSHFSNLGIHITPWRILWIWLFEYLQITC